MRSFLLIVCCLLSAPALADLTSIPCDACRSVDEYPRDYGNHAYNEVLGDTPSLSLLEGSRVKVTNPQNDWAIVDLSFVLSETGFSLSLLIISYAFVLPDGTIHIRVQDPDGETLEYDVFAESPDLRVGDGSGPTEQEASPSYEQPADIQGTNVGSEPLPGSYTQSSYPYSMYGSWLAPIRERHYALQ